RCTFSRVCCVGLPRPPRPTLSPYTTLFRSEAGIGVRWRGHFQAGPGRLEQRIRLMALRDYIADADGATSLVMLGDQAVLTHPARSEEHTSELQSRENLVCRLLLEKKKLNRL